VLLRNGGVDTTQQFHVFHHPSVLQKYGPRLLIGEVASDASDARPLLPPGAFGDMIPYGDPIWYQRFNSPYYKDTHRRWREKVRRFVDEDVIATMASWAEDERPPAAVLEKMGRLGILGTLCGPPWPTAYVPADVEGPEDFDYFHELIVYDELSRCGSSPVIAALTNGPAIGLPAIMRFASEELKQRVAPDVFMGRKFIALAISEPHAGSDVAGLQTTARREGDFYIVSGNKKWITVCCPRFTQRDTKRERERPH